jgi:hypothetical protein
MLMLEAIGILLAGAAAIVFAYPLLYPEAVRNGETVKPGNDLHKAIKRVGSPIWLTDGRLFKIGTVLVIFATIFLIARSAG